METKKKYSLPKAFAKKWIKALRSGKYQQTTETLKELDENGNASYCCLGVACEINKVKIPMRGHRTVFGNIQAKSGDSRLVGVDKLPRQIRLFKSKTTGGFRLNYLTEELVTLNDDDGQSFEGIADWIEENVRFY